MVKGDIEHLRTLHPNIRFDGSKIFDPFDMSDPSSNYILSVLRGNCSIPPNFSEEKWEKILVFLRKNWISEYFFWRLQDLPKCFQPPQQIVAKLRKGFLATTARMLQLDLQLKEITEAFDNEGVEILVLKGPALAMMVYPHPAARVGSDIDLLILPEMMQSGRKILQKLNYTCLQPRYDQVRPFYKDEVFIKIKKGFKMVELHWALHCFSVLTKRVNIEDLFSRAIKVEANQYSFKALAPVDALIHRALNNAFMHFMDMRLIWVIDIEFLVKNLKTSDDWELLRDRSINSYACLAIELGIRMANVFLALKLPEAFQNYSNWPSPCKKEQKVWNRIAYKKRSMLDLFYLYHWNLRDISTIPMSIFYSLFPPKAYMKHFYRVSGNQSLYFSYIRRWLNWIPFFSKSND